MRQGFSLVELSIVLVILGLITGGILTGQNLIRAAELRAVASEFTAYKTAAHTFKSKYLALPGDMTNATDFWGEADADPATCKLTASTGVETCNGDGDGIISGEATTSNESFRFWQHLTNAGMMTGDYNGISEGTNRWSATYNNSPNSKFDNAIWFVWNWGRPSAGSATFYAGEYGNRFAIGVPEPNREPDGVLFSPEEAWNIDTKLDDGMPGTGFIVAKARDDCDSSTSQTDYTGTYLLTDKSRICGLIFRNLF